MKMCKENFTMKRTLAITATTAMLALSLAGCGAERNGDVDLLPDFDGTNGEYGTTATDTMQNGTNSTNGTGAYGGATANTNTANNGLGSVTGAVNRGTQYGSARYGGATSGNYAGSNAVNNAGYNATHGIGGPNSSVYAATNNGGWTGANATASEKDAAAMADRYALMLENGRVHDTDGYLLDGENSSYRTF